jgi:hypothetical protein
VISCQQIRDRGCEVVRTKLVLAILFVLGLMRTQAQVVEVPPRADPPARPAVGLSKIRGYVADPTWARIPKAKLILQRKQGSVFQDVESLESDHQAGQFDFGKVSPGIYRLLIRAPGFCEPSVPVKLSAKGWSGLRIAVPVAISDDLSGHCEKELKLQRLEE